MEPIAGIAQCFVASVLSIAAMAKLARLEDFRITLDELRIAVPYPTVLIGGLVLAEICAASLIVFAPRFGAVLALVLLAAFSGLALTIRVRRMSVACNCFGPLASSALGVATVLRNVVIAAPALLVLASAPQDVSLPSLLIGTLFAALLVMLEAALGTATMSRGEIVALARGTEP